MDGSPTRSLFWQSARGPANNGHGQQQRRGRQGAAGKFAPEAANDHVPSLALALALALLALVLALLVCALELLALALDLLALGPLALPLLPLSFFQIKQKAAVDALRALRGMGGLLESLREEGKKAEIKN